ncbi:Alpha/beta hydrolase [Streptomyces sp. 2224.1]|uniref:alpha/beta hydrolase n=1 Tax=unclassified Streptomyces TaxID=2593676 RepID=UPI0008816B82|nr:MULTISPECIES: alpha/beta hydrolase [unclassified Streptomyces]PBC82215.1 alpha/beta hydrolase family protein [Streptomyces sp. 2321.6]SDR50851.1 Alpha/beta hydrolase [Streptomyces sp. KS_16]SEC48431.1 Alpha/beta hydrolase [Streptomyces sp. 2133.1]SEC55365.1 Alpha/beta hydrolase [Streptomyces sp. 2224.1]SEF00337.1 Alpha/beta hydrolase [Streptomyces sp. 2112.3]
MSRLRSIVQRGRRTLLGAALALTVAAGTGGWAAGTAQSAVTGPAPGAAAWRADHSLGVRLPDPATARPADVTRFFASLTGGQRQALVARHPLTVGNLDGVPPAVRYAANSRALTAERDRRLARAADPAGTLQEHRQARQAAARCASLLSPGRHILAYDPRGRGQVAEVYGDLATAERTAVIVPGSDIDLTSFDRDHQPYGTPAGMARSLRTRLAADAPGTRTAVIAWAGYTTPVGLGPDAMTGRLADAGAPRLARFLSGLAAVGAPAPAVLCHSYGSVVCGLAASQSARGDIADLVLFGSPGVRRDNVAQLHTSARVWAARDASDWISDVPNVELWGLGHGTDPTDPAFGARRVSAVRAVGHAGYLAPGTDSLRNFAAIVLGRYGAVR